MASRTIPILKKDGSCRPVGIGDVLRRVCLKPIERHHHEKVINACKYQYGNGQALGSESIIHALNQARTNDARTCILVVDATNAFNVVNRATALDSIYQRTPELYLTSYNTYG